MFTWTTDCVDTLDESQCEVFKQGVEELWTQNDNLLTLLNGFNDHLINVVDILNHTSAYVYFFGCLFIAIVIIIYIFKFIFSNANYF
jgi:hypothetical protein